MRRLLNIAKSTFGRLRGENHRDKPLASAASDKAASVRPDWHLAHLASGLKPGLAKADAACALHKHALTKLDAADYDFKLLAAELDGALNWPPASPRPAPLPSSPRRRRRLSQQRGGRSSPNAA